MTGCILACIQIRQDVSSQVIQCTLENRSIVPINVTDVSFPTPTPNGYFAAFGSIMFAFGGASTFPTIQADMADKGQFKMAAVLAMTILFLVYFPTAATAYFSLGSCVNENIILSMSDGGLKMAADCVILLHLVAAMPIVINPPSQYFEELLHIPKGHYVSLFLSSFCVYFVRSLDWIIYIILKMYLYRFMFMSASKLFFVHPVQTQLCLCINKTTDHLYKSIPNPILHRTFVSVLIALDFQFVAPRCCILCKLFWSLEFCWKRCAFRTGTLALLLLVGQSVPSFGSILDLVGGSTITCLTFIMPPLLYIFAMDHSETR